MNNSGMPGLAGFSFPFHRAFAQGPPTEKEL